MNVEGMLHLFAAEPSLLPLAPKEASGDDIERRRTTEVHACAYCGDLAETAVIVLVPGEEAAEGTPVQRWLDLCMPHFTEISATA
jgi:hypothetical protein